MDLLTGLYAGRESLISHGSALATLSDNIANSNTTAFKSERTEFSGLLSNALGGVYSPTMSYGNGVAVDGTKTNLAQGPIEDTGQNLDFAIEGDGYFVLSDGTTNYYTRAGNFKSDASGKLVTESGLNVMGYLPSAPETLTTLSVNNTFVDATATSLMTLTGNLSVSSAVTSVPAGAQTYEELSSAANFHTVASLYDSLGVNHDVDMYFYKTGTNAWQVQAYCDASETGGTAGVPAQIGSTTLSFPTDGKFPEGTAVEMQLSGAWTGAANSAVTVDLSGMRQVGGSSALNSIAADGNPSGTITGIEVDQNGQIVGTLDGGGQTVLGTIALAKFVNPDSLDKLGDNLYQAGEESSAVAIGNPNSDGRGIVQNGELEQSNVDQASEFVNVIRYQRGYQAGSQVIQTMNELLNTTLQIA